MTRDTIKAIITHFAKDLDLNLKEFYVIADNNGERHALFYSNLFLLLALNELNQQGA